MSTHSVSSLSVARSWTSSRGADGRMVPYDEWASPDSFFTLNLTVSTPFRPRYINAPPERFRPPPFMMQASALKSLPRSAFKAGKFGEPISSSPSTKNYRL